MQRALSLVCEVCGDKGWVQVAPVEETDTLARPNIRAAFVGTFHEVPCFCSTNPPTVLKGLDNG